MRSLLSLSRGIDRVTGWIGKSVGWLIFFAIFVSAVNAVVRKIFDTSSNAWLELQWYLFGAAFLLASAYTLCQSEHIRIDILYGAASRQVQHWIDLLGHIFFLMPFVILMDLYLAPYALHSWQIQEMSTNAGGLILWPSRWPRTGLCSSCWASGSRRFRASRSTSAGHFCRRCPSGSGGG